MQIQESFLRAVFLLFVGCFLLKNGLVHFPGAQGHVFQVSLVLQ